MCRTFYLKVAVRLLGIAVRTSTHLYATSWDFKLMSHYQMMSLILSIMWSWILCHRQMLVIQWCSAFTICINYIARQLYPDTTMSHFISLTCPYSGIEYYMSPTLYMNKRFNAALLFFTNNMSIYQISHNLAAFN